MGSSLSSHLFLVYKENEKIDISINLRLISIWSTSIHQSLIMCLWCGDMPYDYSLVECERAKMNISRTSSSGQEDNSSNVHQRPVVRIAPLYEEFSSSTNSPSPRWTPSLSPRWSPYPSPAWSPHPSPSWSPVSSWSYQNSPGEYTEQENLCKYYYCN